MIMHQNESTSPSTVKIVSLLFPISWTELFASHLNTNWPAFSIVLIKVPDVPMFVITAPFSYSKKVCTAGLASAVHVKFITSPVHTLLVVFVVKCAFAG